jgi:hypothetical protein
MRSDNSSHECRIPTAAARREKNVSKSLSTNRKLEQDGGTYGGLHTWLLRMSSSFSLFVSVLCLPAGLAVGSSPLAQLSSAQCSDPRCAERKREEEERRAAVYACRWSDSRGHGHARSLPHCAAVPFSLCPPALSVCLWPERARVNVRATTGRDTPTQAEHTMGRQSAKDGDARDGQPICGCTPVELAHRVR